MTADDLTRRAGRTTRRALTGSVAIAALLAGAGLAQAKTPAPAFAPLHLPKASIVVVTGTLQAHDHGQLSLRLTREASCSLSFAGPRHLRVGPFQSPRATGYVTWRWTVGAAARGGLWTARAVCRGTGAPAVLRTHLLTAATARNRTSLVGAHSMKVSVSRRAPSALLAAGSPVGGKGAQSYPNDAAKCKWTGARNGPCHDYDWGYLQPNGTWRLLSERGFAYRNCTDFVAWFEGVTWSSFRFTAGKGNAADWRDFAGNAGFQVSGSPSVGDIAWWGTERASGYGHVAVVTAVAPSGSVTIAEYNGDAMGDFDLRPNVRADAYLHRPAPAPSVAPIVGAPATPAPQAPANPGTTQPSPTTPSSPTPAAPERTWAEQQGSHGVNTFTNYHNASGLGPRIDANATVRVSCKVHDPTIASVNPDGYWYRIASSPWNDAYYSPANTFWNGDIPGHTPYTHNTDFAVPDC